MDTFPGQSIDFFGAMRSRVYDDKVCVLRAPLLDEIAATPDRICEQACAGCDHHLDIF